MPWTFAHPAAALAFNSIRKKPVEFAALVIGTTSPDISYYLGSAGLNLRTHSLIGSLKLCLPMALALLLALILLRHPLCLLLPKPHRQALSPLLNFRGPNSVKNGVKICMWILIGAWTHIAWDACTHRTGFAVQHIPMMVSVWLLGWPGYQLAQHLSSALGVLTLCISYCNWLRSQRMACNTDDGLESWRWRLIFASASAASLLGLTHALALADAESTLLFWRVLMFQLAIRTTSVFAVLIVLCAIFLTLWVKSPIFSRFRGSKRPF